MKQKRHWLVCLMYFGPLAILFAVPIVAALFLLF